MASRLRIAQPLYETMIDHARAASPEEAVGLLGGVGAEVRRCIPLPNAAGGRHFLADPYAQYRALEELKAARLQPLAVYHSHPGGGVGLSSEDLRFAGRLPWLQLVIALDRWRDPTVEVAAWTVSGDTALPAMLEIVSS